MTAKRAAKGDSRREAGPLPAPSRFLETFDAASGLLGAASQRLFTKETKYESVSWNEAVESLGENADEILREPALERVETRSRRILAQMKGRDTRSRKWAADSLLARFSYLACRMIKPEIAVETGVAFGVSSAFILAAMEENGRGTLHSVDLRPLRRGAKTFHGIAVPDDLRDRWTLHPGSSRRVFPNLLRDFGEVDFFLHDSLHTKRNMRFEFEAVWPNLRPGGVLLADDVERNGAFGELEKKEPSLWRVVADRETDPLHGNKAPVTFGVAVK
jgi:predicted O-methyltransferase YrrM